MYEVEHFTDSIFYQMELTAKYCKSLGMQVFAKLNIPITLDEFSALDVIMLHNRICQRELAQLILKDRANTGRILNSLEERGLIERFVDTKNKRLVRRVMLTEKGKEILQKSSEIVKNHLNQMPKIIKDSEKIYMKEIMEKFREGLKNEVEMKI